MPDITDIERVNYYEGEYLGAVDFEAEQEYHRDMRRRHNLGPHTWGIVTGLDVAQFPNGGPNNEVDVYIQPGVAVDGFGREIVVLSPTQLTAEMFADFPSKQTLTVWIGYLQQLINPDADTCAASSQTNAYSRVQESFQVVVQPIPPTSDPVVVAGNDVSPASTTGWTQPTTLPPLPSVEGTVVIAPDDSVPFQALPDDNTTAAWLVQLGQVLWDGANQVFVQTPNATANQNRQYLGSVASVIYAPAGTLIIQDRSTPSSEFQSAEGPAAAASIIGYSAAGGVVTLTISPAVPTPFPAGQLVRFSGFSSGPTVLNNQLFSVLSSPAPSATSFAIATGIVTGAGADTGTAVPQPLGVAVEVQGTLTVDDQLTAQQDVWLNGGNTYALRFKDAGGSDGDTALNVQRLDGSSSGADLHIHIGDGSNPKTTPQRLTVGYGTSGGGQDTSVLIVSADGSVTVPSGPLNFGNQTGQLINLSGTAYGIGVEAQTLFFQSASNFAWCVGGDYNATQGSNASATRALFIDSDGDVTVNEALVVDNANDNAGNLAPGLTFGNSGSEGISSKRTSGGNQKGLDFYTASNVRVSITSGGNVGIGTTNPGTALDVNGGISVENHTFYLRSPGDAYHHIRYGTVGGLSDSDGYIFNSNFVVAQGPDGGETPRFVVQGSGNVGIGTPSPTKALQVSGAGLFGTDNATINGSVNYGVLYLGDTNHYIRSVFGGGLRLGTAGAPDAIMVQQATGSVEIGTTNPQAYLQIGAFGPYLFQGGGLVATDWASSAVGFNLYRGSDSNWHTVSDGVNGGGFAIYGNTLGDLFVVQVPTAGNVSQSISDGSMYPNNVVFSIASGSPATTTINGNLQVNGVITPMSAKVGYVADRFYSRAKKAFEQGDVVVLHTKPTALFYGVENRIPIVEVTLATKAGDTRVCGIVDEPILSADKTPDLYRTALGKGTVGLMVTLGAYAYCKVDADVAPIEAGDLLTTSDTPGFARRFGPELGSGAGCIIGKALASLDKGKGKIPILISHQ